MGRRQPQVCVGWLPPPRAGARMLRILRSRCRLRAAGARFHRGTGTPCQVLLFFCLGPDASPATWARLKAPSWQVASIPAVPLPQALERLHRPEGLAGGGHDASPSAPALRARKAAPCLEHAGEPTVLPPILVGIQPDILLAAPSFPTGRAAALHARCTAPSECGTTSVTTFTPLSPSTRGSTALPRATPTNPRVAPRERVPKPAAPVAQHMPSAHGAHAQPHHGHSATLPSRVPPAPVPRNAHGAPHLQPPPHLPCPGHTGST